MRGLFYFVVVSILSISTHAQTNWVPGVKKKGKGDHILYFGLGSHRIFYTPGDIHFSSNKNPSFDFTLKNAKGKDNGFLRFNTAPQFSYYGGIYFTKKKFGLEYHYDHIKYFMRPNQVLRLKGTINGQQYDKDTLVGGDFVQLEHSDGGNYAMVNVVKWKRLAADKKEKHYLDLVMKAGVGIVNPKTNSTIMGNHYDEKYHFSGYVIGLESGLRYNFWKRFFVNGSFKMAYANYNDFLIYGGKGKQQWLSAQFNFFVGTMFPL
ncbi:MAG TPA: hypothetical protein VF476_04360 [Chitinophagaceae bacterium]